MSTTDRCCILVDDREHVVRQALGIIGAGQPGGMSNGIKFETRHLAVGDFAILDVQTNKMVALFERKTYADLEASIRGKRRENFERLADEPAVLRAAGQGDDVRAIILMEGEYHHGGHTMTLDALRSFLFHRVLEGKISVWTTSNVSDTIAQLVALARSSATHLNKKERAERTAPIIRARPDILEAAQAAQATRLTSDALRVHNVMARTTPRRPDETQSAIITTRKIAPKEVHEIVAEMMVGIRGVGSRHCTYTDKIRVADVLSSNPIDTLSRRARYVRKKYNEMGPERMHAVLIKIPGLSEARIARLEDAYKFDTLAELADADRETLNAIVFGSRREPKLMERIQACLNYVP